ncbi:20266_t:CDS:2, partial [Gigaspora rosea]
ASYYVLETLYLMHYSCASCYIQLRFTAGIQSTQQIESTLSESFLYDIAEISFDWTMLSLEPENIIESSYLEDNYERCQTSLKVLLRHLQYNDIIQIRIISP